MHPLQEEELYRLATEELNGPERRKDLWKRAVALATDDHDEARYLYTNLRVEEMLAEREQQLGFNAAASGRPILQGHDEPSSESTPEPLLSDVSPSHDALGLDDLSDELEQNRRDQQREQIEKARRYSELNQPSADQTLQLEKTPQQDVDLTGGLDVTQATHLDKSAADITYAQILEEQPHDNESSADQTLNMTAAATGAESQFESDMDDIDRTLDQLDMENVEFGHLRQAAPDAIEDDALLDDNPEIDLDERANQTLDITRHLDDTLDATDIPLPGDPPQVLIGNGRKLYNIFSDSEGKLLAVKNGISWPAMFFTLPWLLLKKLWGTAIVYLALLALVVLGGIALALHIDATTQWTNSLRLITAAFVTLSVIGVVLLPLLLGNGWVRRKLERRGMISHGVLRANSSDHALQQLNA